MELIEGSSKNKTKKMFIPVLFTLLSATCDRAANKELWADQGHVGALIKLR